MFALFYTYIHIILDEHIYVHTHTRYLRWWFVEKVINVFGKGVFRDDIPLLGPHLVRLYYGKKISICLKCICLSLCDQM